MDRQDYVIEVSHVSKSFKDNKVLKDVSLLCESGIAVAQHVGVHRQQ